MVGIFKPMEGNIMYSQLKNKEFLYLKMFQLQNLTINPVWERPDLQFKARESFSGAQWALE